MTGTSSPTITLKSDNVDAAIGVLSSAAARFALTRREQITYRALMISVDCAIVALLVIVLVVILGAEGESESFFLWLGLGIVILGASSLAGALALALSLPLLGRMLRERSRLKALGVTKLSKRLWKASRRSDWIRRIRGVLLIVLSALMVALALLYFAASPGTDVLVFGISSVFIAATLFGARILRNQREQMDLAANAVRLRETLQGLRGTSGLLDSVDVPATVVEQIVSIESAHIASQRRQAILESAASQASGYAIAFADEALAQRAGLDMTGRLDLADVCVDLSAAQVDSAAPDASARRTARGKDVEVDYAIDPQRRTIRITAIRRLADAGLAAVGASDG